MPEVRWSILLSCAVIGVLAFIFAFAVYHSDISSSAAWGTAILSVLVAVLGIGFLTSDGIASALMGVAAGLLVASTSFGIFLLVQHWKSVEVTQEAEFSEVAAAPGNRATVADRGRAVDLGHGSTATLAVDAKDAGGRTTLRLVLGLRDSPEYRGVQDCMPDSRVRVETAALRDPVTVTPGSPVLLQVVPGPVVNAKVSMSTGNSCVMRVRVDEVEFRR